MKISNIYFLISVVFVLFFANESFAVNKIENFKWKDNMSFPIEKYSNDKNVNSIIFVKQINGSNAKIVLLKKNDKNEFEELLSTEGFIGKNGLGKEKEGDSKTPVGDFGIIQAFGIKQNPGTSIDYLKVNENHYCCDEKCEFYNKIIDVAAMNHKCKGEHIIDYSPQYHYAFFLDYNKEGIYPKGSAIFMHCKGKKTYTAGCIAVSESEMIFILRHIDKNTRIIIE